MTAVENLGQYLKFGRMRAELSVVDVSRVAGVQPFDILVWERNDGSVLPLEVVNKLIRLYHLDVEVVFDLILKYQLTRIEEKLNKLMPKDCT